LFSWFRAGEMKFHCLCPLPPWRNLFS